MKKNTIAKSLFHGAGIFSIAILFSVVFQLKWWLFDLASHVFLQAITVTVFYFICLLYMVPVRDTTRSQRYRWIRPGMIVLSLIALLNGYSILSDYCPPGSPTESDKAGIPKKQHNSGKDLTLTVVNLWSANPRPQSVIKYLKESVPRILIIVEITPQWARELTSIHSLYPYRQLKIRNDNFGLGVFSTYPLKNMKTHEIDQRFPILSCTVETGTQNISLFAIHPPPPKHLTYFKIRKTYMKKCGTLIGHTATNDPDERIIVAGDFNAPNWSPCFTDFLRCSNLLDPAKEHGFQLTWPALFPLLMTPLDHCLYSGLKVKSLNTGPWIWSDHFSLETVFSL